MKEILLKMLQAWAIRENSYDSATEGYTVSETEAYESVTNGDKLEADLLYLFSYWSNDIQYIAAHYGIRLRQDAYGQLVLAQDVPPAPNQRSYWDFTENAWVDPEEAV